MAGTTVTVASKLPHGFVARLQMPHVVEVNVAGDLKREKVNVHNPDEPTFIIKGFARKAAAVPSARVVGAHDAIDGGTIGGYALTPGIPKDFWDKWVAQNKEWPPFKNGFVIASERSDFVEGPAREKKAEMSGLEPIIPGRLPPEFRRVKEAS